ncbi:hypothetical protein Cob_v007884 [Colletotrichum orbiculare MAFF 240422]|uniref:Uncharacterized protein n=1 Tax=Colletotrichum orbiculare (strain 104-T / ATCC 96160 / CBS 514.97 / LARS 414 / MAFF 240422) TaxID=1213857 RepID=A0A484FNU6_COLOR|nr:hypothetical protein Cob_v007884 [Colletotrichum orbiculare MAFF 240422]
MSRSGTGDNKADNRSVALLVHFLNHSHFDGWILNPSSPFLRFATGSLTKRQGRPSKSATYTPHRASRSAPHLRRPSPSPHVVSFSHIVALLGCFKTRIDKFLDKFSLGYNISSNLAVITLHRRPATNFTARIASHQSTRGH